MKKTICIVALCLMFAAGCTVLTDAVTGEKTYQVDTNVTDKVEAVAEVGTLLAPFFGGAGVMVASALAGGLATWRKVKPKLTTAQTAADHYHAAAGATVEAIETFKELSPDTWEVLGGLIEKQLRKQGIDPLVVENTIRGLRGLPAKS
jgi:hypothetical protein